MAEAPVVLREMWNGVPVMCYACFESVLEDAIEPSLEQVIADSWRSETVELVDLVSELPQMSDGVRSQRTSETVSRYAELTLIYKI